MVKIHKMIEKEMEYRGSKSELINSVKEQRVDGTEYLFRVFKVYSSGLERGTILVMLSLHSCLNYKIAQPFFLTQPFFLVFF